MRRLILPVLTILILTVHLTAADAGESRTSYLEKLPADQWDAAKAAHLLRRAGFGGTAAEIRRLAAMSFDEAVAHIVDYEKQSTKDALPLTLVSVDPNDPAIDKQILRRIKDARREMLEERGMAGGLRQRMGGGGKMRKKMTPEEKRQLDLEAEERAVDGVFGYAQEQSLYQLRGWWMVRMGQTNRPLEEKMTLFWHGHFPSSYDATENAHALADQNKLFRKHATGKFGDLLRGIARDPAMLRYLNGADNEKHAPNENFARELMELFTMGIGNYTEKDVKAAARAFTGWTIEGDKFSYNRFSHDYRKKTFLGKTGHWGGEDIIRMILEQKATAPFITRKLCRYFMGAEPDDRLVGELAKTFRTGEYALKPMLRKLFSAKAFYAPSVIGARIKSPVELTVGIIRQLGLPAEAFAFAGEFMPSMGQALFAPPNVKGWPGGRTWMNSSTLVARYNFLPQLVDVGVSFPDEPEEAEELRGQMVPRALRKKTSKPDWEKALAKLPIFDTLKGAKTPGEVIDRLTRLMLARPVGKEVRDKLLAAAVDGDDEADELDLSDAEVRETILSIIVLITNLPEYQLG